MQWRTRVLTAGLLLLPVPAAELAPTAASAVGDVLGRGARNDGGPMFGDGEGEVTGAAIAGVVHGVAHAEAGHASAVGDAHAETERVSALGYVRDDDVSVEAGRRAEAGDERFARCPSFEAIELLASPKWITHRVVPRERFDQIVHRYGVREEQLLRWNNLIDPAVPLRKGTSLRVYTDRVPAPRRSIAYTVEPGDTWWRVAAKHGVDASDLRAYNWPYRGKMQPGNTLDVWIDPLIYGWIQGADPILPVPESGSVRRGGVGIGSPDDGRLLGGVKIPPGPGYAIRFPASAYGTSHAVNELLLALARFRERSGFTGRLEIGSMSSVEGGEIGDHLSHQSGRDVDIRLPRRVDVPRGVPLTPRRVDWFATWELLLAFDDPEVVVVFLDYAMQKRVHAAAVGRGVDPAALHRVLQYPRGSKAQLGMVRHATGHDGHIHVRFACGPCEIECSPRTAGD